MITGQELEANDTKSQVDAEQINEVLKKNQETESDDTVDVEQIDGDDDEEHQEIESDDTVDAEQFDKVDDEVLNEHQEIKSDDRAIGWK